MPRGCVCRADLQVTQVCRAAGTCSIPGACCPQSAFATCPNTPCEMPHPPCGRPFVCGSLISGRPNPCGDSRTAQACCSSCGWCADTQCCIPEDANGTIVTGFTCGGTNGGGFNPQTCDSGFVPSAARHCHAGCVVGILCGLLVVCGVAAFLAWRFLAKRPVCCCDCCRVCFGDRFMHAESGVLGRTSSLTALLARTSA